MINLRQYLIVKVISITLVITFIAMDISWANPDKIYPNTQNLSVESLFQQQMMQKTQKLRSSVLAEMKIRVAVEDIASYLLEGPAQTIDARLNLLTTVKRERIAGLRTHIGLDHVSVKNGAVYVHYKLGSEEKIIIIALKDRIPKKVLASFDWVIGTRFAVKEVEKGYKEPVAEKEDSAKEPEIIITDPVQNEEGTDTTEIRGTSTFSGIRMIMARILLMLLFPFLIANFVLAGQNEATTPEINSDVLTANADPSPGAGDISWDEKIEAYKQNLDPALLKEIEHNIIGLYVISETHYDSSPDIKTPYEKLLDIGDPAVPIIENVIIKRKLDWQFVFPRLLADIGTRRAALALIHVLKNNYTDIYGINPGENTITKPLAKVAPLVIDELEDFMLSRDFSTETRHMKMKNIAYILSKTDFSKVTTGKTISQPAIESLVMSLIDTDNGYATEAIVNIGNDAAPALIKQLEKADTDGKKFVILYALKQLDDPAAYDVLIDILENETDRAVYLMSIEALGNIRDKRAVSHLMDKVREGDYLIGELKLIAKALTKIGGEEAVKGLKEILDTADSKLAYGRMFAALGLADLKGIEAADDISAQLNVLSMDAREQIAERLDSLGWTPSTDEEKVLYLFAKRKFDEVAKMGSVALPSLLYAMENHGGALRREAINVLVEIGDERAMRPLADIADSDDDAEEALYQIAKKNGWKPGWWGDYKMYWYRYPLKALVFTVLAITGILLILFLPRMSRIYGKAGGGPYGGPGRPFQAEIDPDKAPMYYKAKGYTINGESFTDDIKGIEGIKTYLTGQNRLLSMRIEFPGSVTKEFLVDKELANLAEGFDININALIQEAINESLSIRGKGAYKKLNDKPNTPIVIALFSRSRNLFEDHEANNFIGINKLLLKEMGEDTGKDIISALLKVGITHELMHEAGMTDEMRLTREDVDMTFKLVSVHAINIMGLLTALGAFTVYGMYLNSLAAYSDLDHEQDKKLREARKSSPILNKVYERIIKNIKTRFEKEKSLTAGDRFRIVREEIPDNYAHLLGALADLTPQVFNGSYDENAVFNELRLIKQKYGMSDPETDILQLAVAGEITEIPEYVEDDRDINHIVLEQEIKEGGYSFVMIKPDGIQDKGEIINFIKARGLEVVLDGQKRSFSREEAELFYAEHKGKPFFEGLINYMTSGEVLPILVRSPAEDAVKDVRNIIGPTKGMDKRGIVHKNTVRGKLMTNVDRNSSPITNRIHASDSIESVAREASILFGEERLRAIIEKQRPETISKGNILVTGGAGYIGSHTVRELLSQGYDVTIVDNFVKGRHFAVERNKEYAKSIGRKLVLCKGDLADSVFLENVFKTHKIDKVIHFAAFIEVGESVRYPAAFFYNNIMNTIHLLDAMKKAEVDRIVFSSSAAVYGIPDSMPIHENTPTRPINPYGFTKLMMEKMLEHYGMKWVGLRYFNASGASKDGDIGEAHSPESHLIPVAISRLVKGLKMKAFGTNYNTKDGTCLRDYVSVEDLATAHILALEAGDEEINRAYNLGSGNGFTVKEIIEKTAEVLGVPADWIDAGRRPGDPDALVASSIDFQRATGWEINNSDIDTIIKSAAEWDANKPEEVNELKGLPNTGEKVFIKKIISEIKSNKTIPRELKKEILKELNIDRSQAFHVILGEMKDTYAKLVNDPGKKNYGYLQSLKRLNGENNITRILNDPIASEHGDEELIIKLMAFGQGRLFSTWHRLDAHGKRILLNNLRTIDWDEVLTLRQRLVVEGKKAASYYPSFEPSKPITSKRKIAKDKGDEILSWGNDRGKTKFSGILVAGGRGSGLKYNHAKGLYPGTPLSNVSLYETIIKKLSAAARSHGHSKMYPLVVMVSDQTDTETIRFMSGLSEWDDIKDRILFVHQKSLPVLERSTGEALLKNETDIKTGGAGHGDAFDYVLNPDAGTKGLLWNEEENKFTSTQVVPWLESMGVEYSQYMNVENMLNPLAESHFVGEHVLSRDKSIESEGRAHISLGMIRKTLWSSEMMTFYDRLGNVIIVNGRKESVDYGDSDDNINACPFGDPSIRLVTISSLSGSIPIEYSVQNKTDNDLEGRTVKIHKFERSSGNKKRYGVEIGFEADDVFAPIKYRSDESQVETPRTAKKLQSDHWKKLIEQALPGAEMPEDMIIELPWIADYISIDELREQLERLRFTAYIEAGIGIEVSDYFNSLTTVDISNGLPEPEAEGITGTEEEVKELFEIVRSYVNNRRSVTVNTTNELISQMLVKTGSMQVMDSRPVERDDITASVIERIEKLFLNPSLRRIQESVSIKDKNISDTLNRFIKDQEEFDEDKLLTRLRTHFTQPLEDISDEDIRIYILSRYVALNIPALETDSILASLIIMSENAPKDQFVILGLEDANWIPGNISRRHQHSAINTLLNELEDIDETLESLGITNIIVVKGEGSGLAGNILREAERTGTDLKNVVVMASRKTVESAAFNPLRSTPDLKKAFLAGIDPKELLKYYMDNKENSDRQTAVNITRMLSITLEMARSEDGRQAPDLPIIIEYDPKTRMIIFLPRIEEKNINELKRFYKLRLESLHSA